MEKGKEYNYVKEMITLIFQLVIITNRTYRCFEWNLQFMDTINFFVFVDLVGIIHAWVLVHGVPGEK